MISNDSLREDAAEGRAEIEMAMGQAVVCDSSDSLSERGCVDR